MADLTAVTSYLSFWLPNGVSFSPIEQAMISAGCVLFLLILNLLTVRLFGEVEFWFAIIKIVAIIALVLAGIYMVVTKFQSPSGSVAAISNIWNHGGMFPHGVNGFLAGFRLRSLLLLG